MEDTNKSAGASFMEKYLTPIAVLVGAVIIAGAFIFGHGTAPQPADQGQQQAASVNIKDVKTDGEPFIGDANAPVTMAFWFDYQCPFCKQFESTVMPTLVSQYVSAGKLKIVFKDFQFLGERSQTPGRDDSMTAAEFGRAVWEAYPDKFYDWYKAMFVAQDNENGGFGDLASIKTLTGQIPGIDVNKVVALMTEKKAQYDAAINADRAEAQKFGINGTPSMIVGTQLLSGAQPASAVTPLIDAQLKK